MMRPLMPVLVALARVGARRFRMDGWALLGGQLGVVRSR
jgi:hypothetical protein